MIDEIVNRLKGNIYLVLVFRNLLRHTHPCLQKILILASFLEAGSVLHRSCALNIIIRNNNNSDKSLFSLGVCDGPHFLKEFAEPAQTPRLFPPEVSDVQVVKPSQCCGKVYMTCLLLLGCVCRLCTYCEPTGSAVGRADTPSTLVISWEVIGAATSAAACLFCCFEKFPRMASLGPEGAGRMSKIVTSCSLSINLFDLLNIFGKYKLFYVNLDVVFFM